MARERANTTTLDFISATFYLLYYTQFALNLRSCGVQVFSFIFLKLGFLLKIQIH